MEKHIIRFQKQENGRVKLQYSDSQGNWQDIPLVDLEGKPLTDEVFLGPTLRARPDADQK